ncbi:porin family protein [Bacteroidota bacterium]
MRLKSSLIIIFIISINCTLKSQQFNGGIFAGVSATQITGDQLSGFNKAGLYLGGYVNYYFKKRVSIQMEIDYIQKGSRKNSDPDNFDFESYKLNLQYIDIPIILKYDYSSKLIFETGPYLGFLMNVSQKDHNGEIPIINEFHKNDYGILLGLNYQLNDQLKMNFRYSNSLFPVREHSSGATYRLNKGQYNMVVTLSLHYQF